MKLPWLAFAVCMALSPAACHAANSCPWVNDATAFGALSADASPAAEQSQVTASTCIFTYREQSESLELRITVEQKEDAAQAFSMKKAQCGSDMKSLPSLGNEAILCAANEADHICAEQIIGRVRDQIFTVILTANVEGGQATPREAFKQSVRTIAEQVSGNLF